MPNSRTPPTLFDVGVNLYSKQFKHNTQAMLERAVEAGVESMIAIASDADESVELHRSEPVLMPKVWTTAGIHPHQASTFGTLSLDAIRGCLNDSRCVAVGECGLDYNRMFSSKSEQITAFNHQIELATELGLPLYLHQRDAHDDFVSALSAQFGQTSVLGVVHCFTENRTRLREYLNMGLYIGVTGWVCDEHRGADLRDALSFIPKDRILLETDAPYLKPKGYSGSFKTKRNEPCLLPFIAEYVAEQTGWKLPHLIEQTTENAHRLFMTKL
jgi:TatD DNase family protein